MTDANAPCGFFYCERSCWFRATGLTHGLPSSNPTPSATKQHVFPVKTRVLRRLLRLTRATHQGARQRTRVVDLFGQHLQASTCMDAKELQRNWPEMRKTLGKPGFCSTGFRKLAERTGTELLGVSPRFLESSKGTR